jgi:ferredoxin
LIDIGYKDKIMLFYGVRHIPEVALLKDLAAVAKSGVSVNICLSSPVEEVPQDIVDMSINLLTGTDEKGFPIINHPGPGIRVSADLLRAMITEPDESDYYLCGPPPMMKSLVDGLYFWGMPQERVHWEGFGPCAVTWPADIINSPLKPCGLTVVDLKNNDKAFLDWSASKGTLLTLLDQNKGKVRAVKRQCGQGACGQCKLTCRGKVVYDRKPTYKGLQPNECLTCCGRPDGDLLLFLNS